MRSLFATIAVLCTTLAPASAQTMDSMQAPAGALRVLQVPIDTNRAFAMPRVIQLLHAVPRKEPVGVVLDFERLIDALDTLDRGLLRTNNSTITLAMSAGAERDALRDVLEALGLRLRERQRTYSAEPVESRSAADLRALLVRAGIDAGDVQRRLNAGDAVQIVAPVVELPLPLRFEEWLSILGAPVQRNRLFSAIVRSRDASLMYYGLLSMTADTRLFVARNPALLTWLRDRAAIVAAFGGAFRVDRDGRVVMPGGAAADESWEALADEKLTRPDAFMRALFGRDDGRLAYFAASVAALDEPHVRFALGLWMSDRRMRRERVRALYDAFLQMDPSWSISNAPFMRPSYDAALLLSLARVGDDGSLASPSYRKLWAQGADGIELPDQRDRRMREPSSDGVADAAFLAGLLAGKITRERRHVIERIAFTQRNFRDASGAQLQDVLVAMRGYGRFPAAMSALERIGVRSPETFAAAARQCASLESLEPSAAVPLLAQFQGALALLERFARTGAIDPRALEPIVASLVALEVKDGSYQAGVAEWFRSRVLPQLADVSKEGSIDGRVLDALADFAPANARFSWEGEDLVLDASRPRRDLRALRARQGGNTLDVLFAVYADALALRAGQLTLDEVQRQAAALAADAAKLVPARPWPEAPGDVPEVKKIVDRTVKDLNGIRKPQDAAKAARLTVPLIEAVDYLFGETFVALAYAGSTGDAGRKPGSSIDISHRHSFGFTSSGGAGRLAPWQRPTRSTATGGGDAVTGSIMGLDLALADTRLRRLSSDKLPEMPRMNDNDRQTMSSTAALLNPRDLSDSQGAQIVSAIAAGRRRVEQAAADAPALDSIAVDARIAPLRRGLLEWTASRSPRSTTELFSLGELFRLGGGQSHAVGVWGTTQQPLTGCTCIQLPDDDAWELTRGRPDTGQSTARIVDLNLRVAALMTELRVPASLFPDVMAFATQDYVDSVPLVHPDDWAAFVSRAAAVTREQVEDYVSAVVASGPVSPAGRPASR